ncbi:TniQ family protein [Blastococcus saxobsidens]|uniref:TniQ family protein n=1 Tax=Blastococcus saxobsidens TaxID=138336 RepID=A0A6L9W6C6_9ACTN|nr:TniQ family protein [Blastococcus saxobsidens]NEK86954.1 TniQ family protein [Blastococcus saxobsidens]
MSLPRRLPRSLAAHPDESLAGYLLNLCHRLGMTPNELAVRTGLESKTRNEIDTGYAVTLPDGPQEAFATATGLALDEVTRLTLGRYDGHLFDSTAPARAARTVHGALWVAPPLTRYCPQCLADTPDENPDRTTWAVSWQTPWAVACTRHAVLLPHACPACNTSVGNSGVRGVTLIPRVSQPVAHPAACRATVGSAQTLCGARLDHAEALDAPPPVLALQERLNAILDGRAENLTSLGVPVSADQYLRDLRVLAVLLQLANEPSVLAMLPRTLTDPAVDYLAERHARRLHRSKRDRSDRTWTHPPVDSRVTATLLVTAARLLDEDSPSDQLHGLVASTIRNERLLWARIRSTSEPSVGLGRYFQPGRTGVTTTARLRSAAADRTYRITSDHLPAFLDDATYRRVFPMITPTNERNVRRAVPIAITRLITRCSLEEAADLLGYPHYSAEAAVVRTGRALGNGRRTDWFHDTVADLANALDSHHPVNHGHRRRHFTGDWTIPEEDWHGLQQALLGARLARKDTPWAERRPAYDAWIWSLVTGGDPAVAPMVRTQSDSGRTCTGGVMAVLSTLTRRCTDEHVSIVAEYAARLTALIDSSADLANPSDGQPSLEPSRSNAA